MGSSQSSFTLWRSLPLLRGQMGVLIFFPDVGWNQAATGGPGDVGGVDHVVNLLNAIRTNTPESLNCQIETGYKSTLLAHLGNIAHRTGRVLRCDDAGHILDDTEAQALWQRDYEPGWEPTV